MCNIFCGFVFSENIYFILCLRKFINHSGGADFCIHECVTRNLGTIVEKQSYLKIITHYFNYPNNIYVQKVCKKSAVLNFVSINSKLQLD